MSDYICKVDEKYRSACKHLPEYQDTGYCVLHFPGEDKKDDFKKVAESKLAQKDYDFGGAVFPEGTADFQGYEFEANTTFWGATFIGEANFSETRFSAENTSFALTQFSGRYTSFLDAQFSGEETSFEKVKFNSNLRTDFSRAQISGERVSFAEAQFSSEATYFHQAKFSAERTDFSRAEFGSARTSFTQAKFGGKTNFREATFSGQPTFRNVGTANFRGATFAEVVGVDFHNAIFHQMVSFRNAIFENDMQFYGTIFKGEARFRRTTFKGSVDFGPDPDTPLPPEVYTFNARVNFSRAIFEKRVTFIGQHTFNIKQEVVTFRGSLIANPDSFSFDRVLLRPSWFIDTNVRNLRFANVQWSGLPGGPTGSLEAELSAVSRRRDKDEEVNYLLAPHEILAKACQELSISSQRNNYDLEASEFNYWANDALRIGRRDLRHKVYWVLNGYGERPLRAFVVLMLMAIVFGVAFMLAGPSELRVFSSGNLWNAAERVAQSLWYSLGVMTRQSPDPQPTPGFSQVLVIAEGILGPIQIALLVVTFRRKRLWMEVERYPEDRQ